MKNEEKQNKSFKYRGSLGLSDRALTELKTLVEFGKSEITDKAVIAEVEKLKKKNKKKNKKKTNASGVEAIAQSFGTNRQTIYDYMKKNDWKYKSKKSELNEEVAKRTEEKIIQSEVDRGTKAIEDYLEDSKALRAVTRKQIQEQINASKATGRQKEQLAKSFDILKNCKIASEILAINYRNIRVSLGLDKEKDSLEVNVNNNYSELSNKDLLIRKKELEKD